MVGKAVGRGGDICSVQVTPPGSGAPAALAVSDLDRDSGATATHSWAGPSLQTGVRWTLEAGHTYSLQFGLPPDADSRVRIEIARGDKAQTVLAEPLRGTVTFMIITSGSASGPDRAVGTLGRGSAEARDRERPTTRAKPRDRSRSAEPASRSLVSTGFAPRQRAASPADRNRALDSGTEYFFWFQIGEEVAEGNIDRDRSEVDVTGFQAGATLEVALFAFDGEIGVYDGADVGVFEVYGAPDTRGERAVRVKTPAAKPDQPEAAALAGKRLFFPIRLPDAAGTYRLRCNLYYRQVLLQSRLVTVDVTPGGEPRSARPLETVLDYKISKSLRRELFSDVAPHRLSLLLNDNGDGTHGFRFFGQGNAAPFKNDLSIGETDLAARIATVRQTLRQVAWGSPGEWTDAARYRYDPGKPLGDLRADLFRLARAGFRLYDHLASRLANTAGQDDAVARKKARWALEDAMRTPGRVQIAAKQGANLVVPAGLFYDYPFADDDADPATFRLCPAFEEALRTKQPLAATVCFNGQCPTASDTHIICPSGFWGFRHALGFPTIEKLDAAFTIPFSASPRLLMAVSTDDGFVLRTPHEAIMHGLVGDGGWMYAATVDDTYTEMKKDAAQVVYFYCHGGVGQDKTPYIEVGPRNTKRVITKGGLSNARLLWQTHSPLVFINGCHTTALDPETASDLVSGFRDSNAAGVIGTEITIFEPLACLFAERTLTHFFGGAEIGESIRQARLDVLQTGNPLGLVYIPFVLASVILRKAP